MHELDSVAVRFEAIRPHLRAVAYRMLGSVSEADDAVQEAWLHLSRSGADTVDNLGGWLTTVVAFARRAQFARLALVDGRVGLVVAPRGKLAMVLRFAVAGDRITEIDVVADPERLRGLDLAVLA